MLTAAQTKLGNRMQGRHRPHGYIPLLPVTYRAGSIENMHLCPERLEEQENYLGNGGAISASHALDATSGEVLLCGLHSCPSICEHQLLHHTHRLSTQKSRSVFCHMLSRLWAAACVIHCTIVTTQAWQDRGSATGDTGDANLQAKHPSILRAGCPQDPKFASIADSCNAVSSAESRGRRSRHPSVRRDASAGVGIWWHCWSPSRRVLHGHLLYRGRSGQSGRSSHG